MERISKISPFMVMEILKEASNIDHVIHMEIGEPDLDPPPSVIESLERAIKDRRYFYTPSLGIGELREKIAEHYYKKYRVDISPHRVVITTGTSGAFLVAYSILMSAGEKVILADPSYPCYKNFAHLLDINPVFLPVDESTNYTIKVDMIKEHRDVKALHISSPSNPTGSVYGKEDLASLVEYCQERDIYFISDEVYHGLVYDREEHTALEFSDRAIVISGFSKWFCMPGFRIGWMILPEELIPKAERVIQNVFISAPTLSQYAALGAFDYEYLEKVKQTFKKRRDILYEGLKDLFEVPVKPEGAFYIWANINRYLEDSETFCREVLKNAKVAITPGTDFGKNKTKNFVRFSYTKDEEALREGLRRIKNYLIK
ncbi:MAG: pyridoxal phosphate-dependent aminotransferase [Hydrogenobacter thermophilus]|uniref:pyridoxal phosphate-dependent aminotransferase n=1 Tax=Hydrogenobacter thermophilus TaxID=940 RepID=UPI001C795E5B|nr:pyridoxal phosphate-dependent aminotransferase [Hydrogenobacter thermophilus]QWK20023.1 MAG: pyridoxal phosphate-dependent aminotransferase [Hydrogenobacter thermophilus]